MSPFTGTSLLHLPSQLLLFAIDEYIKGKFVLLQHSSWAGALLPPMPLITIFDGGQGSVKWISIEYLHMFSVRDNLTPFMRGALKRARQVSQSVLKSVSRQIVKNILSWIRTCHPSGESRNQEACWEWSPPPWVSIYLLEPIHPSVQSVFGGDCFY